jgi:hypothetical protein
MINDLTPEEQALLAQGTLKDWAEAVAELAVDPSFWGDVGKAFLDGLTGSR